MRTRGLALCFAVALGAGACTRGQTSDPPPSPRPSFLVLVADDLRADAVGFAGNRIVRTPHLDALAAAGVTFANAFVTMSICSGSRASLLTGTYPLRHGVVDFETPLSEEAWRGAWPARLREAGYRLGFVGKWGLGGPLPAERYDDWAGFAGQGRYFEPGDPTHLTDRLAERALAFLDRVDPDTPFALQVSFKAPHAQDRAPVLFAAAARHAALYAQAAIPPPPSATPEAFAALPPFLRESEGRIRWDRRFATPEQHASSLRGYYGLVTGVDEAVGRLVAKLAERGLAGRTLILFTSDNGLLLGEHGLADKWLMYEESIRVPLLVYDPRLPPRLRGRRLAAMVLNLDVAPTLLELAGLPLPAGVQGRSLAPLLAGQSVPGRSEWLYEHRYAHPRIPRSEGVRSEAWKYARYLDGEPGYEQLFDLRADPHELRNLAGDPAHARILAEMRARLARLRTEAAR